VTKLSGSHAKYVGAFVRLEGAPRQRRNLETIGVLASTNSLCYRKFSHAVGIQARRERETLSGAKSLGGKIRIWI